MQIEKEIKQRARAALSGNMSSLLAAAGFTATVMLLVEYLEYLVISLTNTVNLDTSEVADDKLFIYFVIVSLFVALAAFASPLVNGFLRMAANTAMYQKCRGGDVIYYFRSGGLYFRTVLFNSLLMVMFRLGSAMLNLSGYLAMLDPSLFDASPSFTPEYLLTLFVRLITGLIGVIVYFLLAHYPLMRYALCDNIGIVRCVFGTMGFSFRNFGKVLRLALSFAGWFALCFFVVPALYVLPYFSVASLMSARWLFQLENRGVEP